MLRKNISKAGTVMKKSNILFGLIIISFIYNPALMLVNAEAQSTKSDVLVADSKLEAPVISSSAPSTVLTPQANNLDAAIPDQDTVYNNNWILVNTFLYYFFRFFSWFS